MSLELAVDLSTATVAYRPAVGEERSVAAEKVSAAALFDAAPWRTFRWYFGQRHYSGTYWSATLRDHVIYESRLELANLLLADFDPEVLHIVAQPFLMCAEVDGQVRKHIPDYLWDSDSGPVVVDVVRAERMSQPKVELLCIWTRQVVESLGWSYRVVHEPPRIRLSNLRFLAGYRRDWLIKQSILDEVRRSPGLFAGMSIADAEQTVRGHPQQLVRPALMHLLWRHEYRADLDAPLRPSTVLEASL
ncbi:TnsA-like heteromeric transposase endonuclease subunit [Mycobacterium avium subsp. hominissuis]